MDDETLR